MMVNLGQALLWERVDCLDVYVLYVVNVCVVCACVFVWYVCVMSCVCAMCAYMYMYVS